MIGSVEWFAASKKARHVWPASTSRFWLVRQLAVDVGVEGDLDVRLPGAPGSAGRLYPPSSSFASWRRVVPARAWQNMRYSGTAAYERPTAPSATANIPAASDALRPLLPSLRCRCVLRLSSPWRQGARRPAAAAPPQRPRADAAAQWPPPRQRAAAFQRELAARGGGVELWRWHGDRRRRRCGVSSLELASRERGVGTMSARRKLAAAAAAPPQRPPERSTSCADRTMTTTPTGRSKPGWGMLLLERAKENGALLPIAFLVHGAVKAAGAGGRRGGGLRSARRAP